MMTAPRIFSKFLNCAAQGWRLKIQWFLMRFGVKSDWIESNHAKSFVAGYYPSSSTDSPQKLTIVRPIGVEKSGQDTEEGNMQRDITDHSDPDRPPACNRQKSEKTYCGAKLPQCCTVVRWGRGPPRVLLLLAPLHLIRKNIFSASFIKCPL